jgi:hypothetical protein
MDSSDYRYWSNCTSLKASERFNVVFGWSAMLAFYLTLAWLGITWLIAVPLAAFVAVGLNGLFEVKWKQGYAMGREVGILVERDAQETKLKGGKEAC